MMATYKVVDGKTIRPKNMPASPFSTDKSNAILSENIIRRLAGVPELTAAQNRHIELQKSERRILWAGFGISLLLTAGIHFDGLMVAQSINWKAVIDTWFLAAAGVLVILAMAAIITREVDNIKSIPTKKIIMASEDALQAYFDDFVRERATGECRDTSLIEVTEFKVKTATNDSSLRSREVLLQGVLKNAGSVTAASVNLRFDASYTNLYVYRYDVIETI